MKKRSLGKYQKGGTTKSSSQRAPIAVTDPNDFRLRAYTDSSTLYNAGEQLKNYLLKPSTTFDDFDRATAGNVNPFYKPSVVMAVRDLTTLNGKKPATGRKVTRDYDHARIDLSLPSKPVQPYTYQKFIAPPIAPPIQQSAPQPIAIPIVPTIPIYNTPQQMYQGREFMETTGLQPGNYHPEEVQAALANQTAKGKRAFANGGMIQYQKGGKVKPNVSPDMIRTDGTLKGKGYLGPMANGEDTSTELSIGIELDGKEALVPTMVPTLNKMELDYLLNNQYNPQARNGVSDIISRKAEAFARSRRDKGLPYFAKPEEEGTYKVQPLVPRVPNSYWSQYPQQYQKGGTVKDSKTLGEDFTYEKWRRSLPNNLQNEDPSYNLRGYWEGLNKPEKFQPFENEVQSDGYYHATSRNPYTGEIFKGITHPTLHHALGEKGYPNRFVNGKLYSLDEDQYAKGGIIQDDKGQWAHPGEITKINSNRITIKGVNYPVMGVDNLGNKQMMMPNGEYKFDGTNVTEYPIIENNMNEYKKGGSIHIKPSHRGLLHKNLGVPAGEKIPASKLAVHEGDSTAVKKRKIFAQNAKKWQHADGGLIQYQLGGNTSATTAGTSFGGTMQLGSMAGNVLLSAIPDKTYNDANGEPIGTVESKGEAIGKGALKGAAAGAMFGPIGAGVGAVVGGGLGYINQRRDEKELQKTQKLLNNNITTKSRLGGPNSTVNNIATNNSDMYPYGGVVTDDQPEATAELELQEQMQLPDGTVMGVDGPSHENGGIEVNAPEGTRVFSDRLKLGNKTFANRAKSINNKIAALDRKPSNSASENTEILFNKQLDNLFNAQEGLKQQEEMKTKKKLFANGGTIPAERNGMIPATNVNIMRMGGLTQYQNGAQVLGPYSPWEHSAESTPYLGSPLISFGGYKNPMDFEYMTNPKIPKGSDQTTKLNAMWEALIEEDKKLQPSPRMSFKDYLTPQNMAFGAQGVNNIAQNQIIDSLARPGVQKYAALTPGDAPDHVNYSNERSAISGAAAAARRGINLGSRAYSTQAGNYQKLRNDELMNQSKSFQTEYNVNTQLDNAYKQQKAAVYNQNAQMNAATDMYNMENQYNYNLWKTGNKLKSTGSAGDSVTNMFNNKISRDNQMDYYNVLQNMYARNSGTGPTIGSQAVKGSRLEPKKYGGTIQKRSIKR